MRVWIDLSNSPHPLLFAPLVRRLQAEGAEVALTFRDHAQTAALTVERWPDAIEIGGASPASRFGKARGLLARVSELVRWARANRPDVALSHNSYAQIVAARIARVPVVTAMDFEHQPANHLAFRLADRVILPEAIPARLASRQGASKRKVVRYPGLKEELYLADFEPDPRVLERLGIERRNGDSVIVARTAPAGATYHRDENPLLLATLEFVADQAHVRTIVLARHPEQRQLLRERDLPRCYVPDEVLDARSLMAQADVFVGAGGTMTREAALLGLPVYSIFAGRPPAVDDWLVERGLLRRLEAPHELGQVTPRATREVDLEDLRKRGRRIEDVFVAATRDAAQA